MGAAALLNVAAAQNVLSGDYSTRLEGVGSVNPREGASSLNVDSLNDVETINARFESKDTKGHLMIRWRSGVFCEWSDVFK